jgi:hypothetical protein
MFPIHEVRGRIDDYGEVIDISEFKKFELEAPPDVDIVDHLSRIWSHRSKRRSK